MRVTRARRTFASALALAAALAAGPAGAQPLQTVKVADGVYAILQPFDNRFNDSNATVIVGDAHVMVIDSQVGPASAEAVIAEVRKITTRPVRYVVATHWHGDHFQGNEAYRRAYPGVEFVAQQAAADDMRRRATAMRQEDIESLRREIPAAEERLAKRVDRQGGALDAEGARLLAESIARNRRYLEALESVAFVFPGMLVHERLEWDLGNRVVRLLHFRGHTSGDLVAWLPQERVLVTGDLVDDMPFLGHGHPADYLRTLDALDALAWDVMIPGHGQIRRGRDHLRAIAAVFTAVYRDVERAVRDGLTLEQTLERVNLRQHRETLAAGEPRAGRAFDGFMPEAVKRMYEELR